MKPMITSKQMVVIEGLDLGLKQHIAKLFSVLVTDPTGVERFRLGLERAVSTYELAVAIVLENSPTGAKNTPTPHRSA
jgi:hypothetical protein